VLIPSKHYRAKEKKTKIGGCKVPWFGHFLVGVVVHFPLISFHLLIVNVAFEDKFIKIL
jgi:hypothetical protein